MSRARFIWTHPIVKRALCDGGWTPDRSVPAQHLLEALRLNGFHVFRDAEEILRRFGGLVIKPPERLQAAFRSGAISFSPISAALGEAPRIALRETQFGCRLCPIGEWSGEYILLVADDGRVFAETTFQVLQLGESFDDALELMICANDSPEVVG
jgi:SUKH-3 immunity protein